MYRGSVTFKKLGLQSVLKFQKNISQCKIVKTLNITSSVIRGSSVYGTGYLHIWKGSINAESYIWVLQQHLLPSR